MIPTSNYRPTLFEHKVHDLRKGDCRSGSTADRTDHRAVGYARCWTGGQDLTVQGDALAALGGEPKWIHVDHRPDRNRPSPARPSRGVHHVPLRARACGRPGGRQPSSKPSQEAHLVELWRAGTTPATNSPSCSPLPAPRSIARCNGSRCSMGKSFCSPLDGSSTSTTPQHDRRSTHPGVPGGLLYRARLERLRRTRGIPAVRLMEHGTLEGILGCVGAGPGISLMPRRAVEHHVDDGRVRAHPDDKAHAETIFVRRSNTRPSIARTRFIDHLRGAAEPPAPRSAGAGEPSPFDPDRHPRRRTRGRRDRDARDLAVASLKGRPVQSPRVGDASVSTE